MIQLDRSFVDILPTLNHDSLKIFLVLMDRSVSNLAMGMTLNELARAADVGQQSCRRALQSLAEPQAVEGVLLSDQPLIILNKRSKWTDITIAPHWMTDGNTIRFSYDDTDSTKVAKAEAEMRRLDTEYQKRLSGERSGMADYLKGEERDLVVEIESRRGYGLQPMEAYLLGKAVAYFGPDRFKAAWKRMQRSKHPIRAAYGALNNLAFGAKAEYTPPKEKGPTYKRRN